MWGRETAADGLRVGFCGTGAQTGSPSLGLDAGAADSPLHPTSLPSSIPQPGPYSAPLPLCSSSCSTCHLFLEKGPGNRSTACFVVLWGTPARSLAWGGGREEAGQQWVGREFYLFRRHPRGRLPQVSPRNQPSFLPPSLPSVPLLLPLFRHPSVTSSLSPG